ncbi:hypothetical protein [Roseimaritima sediminicola]|uniref:hypothetical protein n=1 Tax=Roseimaritima sediminicola TaxID=2662066 RepID=UPI001F3A9C8B|nr:hypothetical protein [Roseimaritima sediminicola]
MPPRYRPLTLLLTLCCAWLAVAGGCGRLAYRLSTPVPEQVVANPVDIPPVADDFLWLQVVDVVDDYFRIQRERPVQNHPGLVLEGRLDTSYRVGASIFEPWRKDSTAGFERWQSTLQSIRRRATVFVRPQGSGYVLEVVVQKELEDTDRSLEATEGLASVRSDGTVERSTDSLPQAPTTLGWIPLGRDVALEQVILQDILGRLQQPDGPSLLHH